ncbi:MAG: hypothetical protein COY70_01805 [Candidatus Magasanikbacteria bacterium CG_4_10_14_0_8_um_filter_42_12]|nr:MAG: hypothetical protein COY70_01805 [Candidatus Magasanikbacteria bacterium CG_4_10_14_0_8_um_filter_42_12]
MTKWLFFDYLCISWELFQRQEEDAMMTFIFEGETFEVCPDRLEAKQGICYVFHPSSGWMMLSVLRFVRCGGLEVKDSSPWSPRGPSVLVAHRLGGNQELITAQEKTYDNEDAFALARTRHGFFGVSALVWSALVLGLTVMALFIAYNSGH